MILNNLIKIYSFFSTFYWIIMGFKIWINDSFWCIFAQCAVSDGPNSYITFRIPLQESYHSYENVHTYLVPSDKAVP